MTFEFGILTFEIKDEKIFIKKCANFENSTCGAFTYLHIAGENKDSHMGGKLACSSEEENFKYLSHSIRDNKLEIITKSEKIKVKTTFTKLENTISALCEVENISGEEIVIEEISPLVIRGLGNTEATEGLYFTRFIQSHHTECQPQKFSFPQLGFFKNSNQPAAQKKIAFTNVGSWSTKEELPQGIIESEKCGVLMFQIESPASWHYEISDFKNEFYLCLCGSATADAGFFKKLLPGECYRTVKVAVGTGKSVAQTLDSMTYYRRSNISLCKNDKSLPVIFNEYMHLSWDSPEFENTKIYAKAAADVGADCYVIDCGWHNEEPGDKIYPYVGQWKESKTRFPEGVRAATDYIRSLGMCAGLWIEPEIVGMKCAEMLDYYDEDCFLARHGKKICVFGRYFLDYRNAKVQDYMSETIRRMVEDYGADYIKFDYNQDMGIGCDNDGESFGAGLESAALAFLSWVEKMREKYPQIIFEGCASGGMRMDARSLSAFSLYSTSDQTDYLKYPYIAGNILSAVLPEQAAVWSYPVGDAQIEDVDDDRIVMNMVNSFIGRIHLASHIEKMNERQKSIIREGVEFYREISKDKVSATPFMPLGFCGFGDSFVSSGYRVGKKIYLATWCLGDMRELKLNIGEKIKNAYIGYPKAENAKLEFCENMLHLKFERTKSANFAVIELC